MIDCRRWPPISFAVKWLSSSPIPPARSPPRWQVATTTIPIVFSSGSDPVKLGLVASLSRPGGNVTGVSFFANDLEAKRLGLLHELAPRATVIAVLANPNFPDTADRLRELQDAAGTLGKQLRVR